MIGSISIGIIVRLGGVICRRGCMICGRIVGGCRSLVCGWVIARLVTRLVTCLRRFIVVIMVVGVGRVVFI